MEYPGGYSGQFVYKWNFNFPGSKKGSINLGYIVRLYIGLYIKSW